MLMYRTSACTCRWMLAMSCLVAIPSLSVAEDQQANPAVANTTNTTNSPETTPQPVDGRELFLREWVPNDSRSHGGDGLGPLFNDSSCVACHNQGGTGGGGPRGKNVDILTAFSLPIHVPSRPTRPQRHVSRQKPSVAEQLLGSLLHKPSDKPATLKPQEKQSANEEAKEAAEFKRRQEELVKATKKRQQQQLTGFHPGFAQGNSIVLHRGATYAGYQAWRDNAAQGALRAASFPNLEMFDANSGTNSNTTSQAVPRVHRQQRLRVQQQQPSTMQARLGNFTVTRSQRNATALFGAGRIEGISKETLVALAEQQRKGGVVSGRVPLLKDNKIGRFGWKGQTANLHDFVLTACAVEVGLNVPNHPQSGVPHSPKYRPTGFDMDMEECNALTEYVRDLPAPVQANTTDEHNAKFFQAGEAVFARVGCANCHVENVGDIQGLFSDLLLHDMGDALGDSGGSYGIFVPDSTPEGDVIPQMANSQSEKQVIGATRKEWRTPALWGVRDSAPYLHDGRADTLEQAIALHGGESEHSVNMYFALSDEERFQLVSFLKSLTAPVQ